VSAVTVHAGDDLPLTVPALLQARVATHGGAPFVVCDDDVLTYAGAERRSAALAKGLLAIGTGKGTPVGILHPNGSGFVTAALAAARIGAVAVPLSTFSTPAELAGLLRGADVRVLLSARSYRSHDYVAALTAAVPELDLGAPPPTAAPSTPALRHLAFSDAVDLAALPPAWTLEALIAAGEAVAPEVLAAAEQGVTPADRLVVVHTSGSTSEPKGVVHCHGPLIRHQDNLNEIRAYTPAEVLFSNSPFFWIGGYAYCLLGTLVAGARLLCSNSADAAAVLDLLERERPTMVNGFAASVAHLERDPSFADRDLSSIRRGNLWPIMPEAVRAKDPELRHNMLGMTETGSVCSASPDEADQPEHRRGSFGLPVPGLETRIVDPDTSAVCGPGQPGELHFRGPFLMDGYLGRERHEVFDPDGWYRTGDLAVTDRDGFLYFKGRQGDMIKTAGANVSPREVEAAILDATGLVAHVLGVDDATRGQVVAAAVVVPAGRDLDEAELRAQLAQRLSAYKVPRRVRAFGEGTIPMMSSGKIDARALKELMR